MQLGRVLPIVPVIVPFSILGRIGGDATK